jgi:hypothetical protein
VRRSAWLVLLLSAAAIAAAGLVDHHVKTTRLNHAEVDQWFCAHRGTRCGGADPQRIEDAWNRREVGYQVGIGLAAAAGLMLFAREAYRR